MFDVCSYARFFILSCFLYAEELHMSSRWSKRIEYSNVKVRPLKCASPKSIQNKKNSTAEAVYLAAGAVAGLLPGQYGLLPEQYYRRGSIPYCRDSMVYCRSSITAEAVCAVSRFPDRPHYSSGAPVITHTLLWVTVNGSLQVGGAIIVYVSSSSEEDLSSCS